MKPHVLLIAPPVYDFALFDLFLKPYSLLSMGKGFEKSGYTVTLINALHYNDEESRKVLAKPRRLKNGTGKFLRRSLQNPGILSGFKRNYGRYGILEEVLENKIAAQRPDLVLVSTGMTYWYKGVIEVIRYVRKHHGNVPVIVGGVYATLCTEHCLKMTEADAVIKGDAFPGIIPVLKEYSLPVPCPGNDTDLLILPDLYSEAGVIRLNKGCPFNCHYCASKALSHHFIKGDPIQLFNLVRRIHDTLGTKVFAFYDDALLYNKEEVFIPFLQAVIDSGLSLSLYLPNGIHLKYLDRMTALFMKQAGFKEVRIGFESGDNDFHRTIDQKLEIKECKDKIELLKGAGFGMNEIGLYILAGLPGQYKKEVEGTLRFASQFGVRMYIAQYSPVPGSLLWEKSVELSSYPLAEEPLTHNNTLFPMEWAGFTLADLDEIKTLAHSLSPPKET
ncbi:MAG: radical SAM protein [Spirochaetales bacterium]|nr:radical SAM protein [Spirochaetales bacterium]